MSPAGYVTAHTGELGDDATPTRRHLQPVVDAVGMLDDYTSETDYADVTPALLDRVLDGLRRL